MPQDSMFNARPPAPAFLYGLSLILLCDVILKALAPAIPERIPAAHYGDMAGFMIYGQDENGGLWIQQEPEGGGWGACPHRDGENMMIFIADGDTRNVPCEVIESRFPLRMERYQVRENSGGAGRYRGGLGQYRDYRVLHPDGGFLMGIMGREKCPPWGLFGGLSGDHDVMYVNPGQPDEKRFMKITGYGLKQGDLVSVRTGGGGGYGDPLDRDSEAVRLDVLRGYITADHAADYGVVLTPQGGVDAAATIRQRAALRESR